MLLIKKLQELIGYYYVNEITIGIDALSSKNIRFYKNDKTKDYTYPDKNTVSIIEVNMT